MNLFMLLFLLFLHMPVAGFFPVFPQCPGGLQIPLLGLRHHPFIQFGFALFPILMMIRFQLFDLIEQPFLFGHRGPFPGPGFFSLPFFPFPTQGLFWALRFSSPTFKALEPLLQGILRPIHKEIETAVSGGGFGSIPISERACFSHVPATSNRSSPSREKSRSSRQGDDKFEIRRFHAIKFVGNRVHAIRRRLALLIIIPEMDRQDVGFEADFFAGKSVMELDGAGMLLIAENVADCAGVTRLRFPGFPLQGRLIRLFAPLEKSFESPVADLHPLSRSRGGRGRRTRGESSA